MSGKIFYLLLCITFISIKIYPQGYICAVGGGSEDYADWSDAPYGWIVEKSNNGKIIIIGTSSATSWLPSYFQSLGANQAVNLTISSRTLADAQSTYDQLITANAIFIRGGDQWNYINYWKGTKTEQAILQVFNSGGVIAGTSAGTAVLGSVDFSARYGSVYPDDVLANPFTTNVDLETNFLNLVPGVLFDSHFIERGRSGRLVGMLMKAKINLGLDLLGVGVDDHTAFCIDSSGIGTVMGSGAVAIFYPDMKTQIFSSGTKYIYENLKCDQLTNGWKFDLRHKEIAEYQLSAGQFIPASDSVYTAGNIWISGNSNTANQITQNLTPFLASVNSGKIVLLLQQNTLMAMQPILNYLTANSIQHSVILINTTSLMNADASGEINSAAAFIVAGDSLTKLNMLADTSYILARAFNAAIAVARKPTFFFGKAAKIISAGFVQIPDNEIYASWRGRMSVQHGIGVSGDILIQSITFEDSDYYENRVSALLWGLMKMRKRTGIYISGTDRITIANSGSELQGNGRTPFFIVSAKETIFYDSSVYRASGSAGPRQVAALNNLRYNVSNRSDISFSIPNGKFTVPTGIHSDNYQKSPEDLQIDNMYPNPFNAGVTLTGIVRNSSSLNIRIFSITGALVYTAVLNNIPAGTFRHFINFADYGLNSGLFLCSISAGSFQTSKKIIYLK